MDGMFEPITAASPAFGVLALIVVAAGRFGGGRYFVPVLAATGLIMAASWLDAPKALVLAAALGPNWLVCRYLWGRPDRSSFALVAGSIVWQVALLSATKIAGLSASWGIAGVIGLSYMTFRQVQLVLEAANADQPFSSVLWCSFLINPLTLIAGPIQTWKSHLQGLANLESPTFQQALSACHRIATGLIKVLILKGIFAGQGDFTPLGQAGATWLDWVIAFYSYYIFLYLDFSGYMDIVRGIAVLAGFATLPENFNRPYLSTSFQDFWIRWHITLGLWARTYVFTPLLATLLRRWGAGRQGPAIVGALFVTFFLIGIWHGIAWNFVIFALMHATGVSGAYLYRQWILRRFGKAALRSYEASKPVWVARVLICQHAIAASFIFLDNDVASIWRAIAG
jgi:D-alanyl-lipoteichoic acid acyltransferase DltB (MBOAT superfamily)